MEIFFFFPPFLRLTEGTCFFYCHWFDWEFFLVRHYLSFFFFFSLGSVAATVTPQHLVLNRNSLFQGGLQPHNYCLPVLKRETHRMILFIFWFLSFILFLLTSCREHDTTWMIQTLFIQIGKQLCFRMLNPSTL